ncbi:hypothetical protein RRG08_023120 [Elysia crispata]|uniref:Uncharacterized protein n=1 Tax=Elysia crispata TaxID=231223 RepID=A0AAE0XMJ1_9GAST|nr:hypothetical protein RRG08_023120 [Elysia crispata]
MAARDVSSAVSDEILDEVWLMMHMAAEMGCSHLKPVPQGLVTQGRTVSDSGRIVGEKQYMFEAEVEPEFLEEVVDTDNAEDGREKEELLISVADKLMQLGDELQKRKQQQSEVEEISKEIGAYIKQVMAPEIERKLGPQLSRSSATTVLQETGVLSLVYGVFKKKVETFLGPDEDMSHIALVTSITKGVASGLQQSSSGIAGLLATVSTKYVEEKFGAMLQKKGSLTKIVSQETMGFPQ